MEGPFNPARCRGLCGVAVLFHQTLWLTGLLFIAAFLVTIYFVSPDRLAKLSDAPIRLDAEEQLREAKARQARAEQLRDQAFREARQAKNDAKSLAMKEEKVRANLDNANAELSALKHGPPIYHEQVLELPWDDVRRMLLRQTHETVRMLDPYFAPSEALERLQAERDTARSELTTLQKEHESARNATAELERLRSLIDESASRAWKWQQISHLALTQSQIHDLKVRLETFCAEMNTTRRQGADPVDEWIADGQHNNERFDSRFRVELVQLTNGLKLTYGLLDPQLTEGDVTKPIYGSLGLRPIIEGLERLEGKMSEKLVNEAMRLSRPSGLVQA